MSHYKLEIRGSKNKRFVARVWHDGYFPVNPVKGIDFKDRQCVKYLTNGPDTDSTGQRVDAWTIRQAMTVNQAKLINANDERFLMAA